jgi:hypothetical protein
MDTKDTLVAFGFIIGGGFIAGLNGNNSLGVIVGGLAGLGLLGVILLIGDKVDQTLRNHYNNKGRF